MPQKEIVTLILWLIWPYNHRWMTHSVGRFGSDQFVFAKRSNRAKTSRSRVVSTRAVPSNCAAKGFDESRIAREG
jgi:hypothetical protein